MIFFFVFTVNALAFAGTNWDMNIFTTSTLATKQNSTTYGQHAVIDITRKLNIAIKNHKQLKVLSESCGWCDVIKSDFDEYVKAHLPAKHYGASLVWEKLLHPSITTLDNKTIKLLDDFIYDSLTDIEKQVDYLSNKQLNLDSSGRYSDADLTNSPYDIMHDIYKILNLFLKDPIQYEWYINTMQDDARGLITGRFETGQWAQGETYEIDLASDIASALGQDAENDDDSAGSDQDCEDGFCITLDIITNDSYLLSWNGRSFVDTNFEEIFGSVNDWLIKKGDKRNLACKWPVAVNHFQSNNDQNLFFKNIFRGLGIFVFEKTPKYAKPDWWSSEEKTDKEKEEDTDKLIQKNLKNYNIDTENLLQYTDKQMIEQATPIPQNVGNSARNQNRALQNRKELMQQSTVEADMKEKGNTDKWMKNLFRFFDSTMQSYSGMVKDVFDIVTVWKDKPSCKN